MSETMTLEPCPFCGSGNVVHVTADHPKHAHYVLCMMCDSPSAMRDTPEHAAESWNKRTERDALSAEVERLRNEERVERCESGDPACGPVEFHDSEGVPLCKACWDALVAENGAQAQPPAERGEG